MFNLGIDTGGTFVDLVVMDGQGNMRIFKSPTTPRNYLTGILQALELAAAELHLSLEELLADTTKFIYGTTIATNYVLEGKGRGRAGLLATKGFKDTLHIRRGIRRSVFDTQDPFPEPAIRRHQIREINERVDWAGNILVPLDEDEVRRVAAALVQDSHAGDMELEAIAICFMHSYVNPVHERKAAEILRDMFPKLYITASVEVAAEIREYERTSTVAFNALMGKIFSAHLRELEKGLRDRGLRVPPQVILSSGGISGIADAGSRPVNSLFSGMSGGAIAARHYSSLIGAPNIMSVDMGGTSFDVGIIRDGVAGTTLFSQVNDYPILGERLEIHSIGAGGGSIAWVDEHGILKVGPRSAGADPGPCCYGRGGTEPTVTDADVVLGYIDPGYFLGGRIKLDAARSRCAIREKVADKMGISLVEAAGGINKIVDNNMVNAIRLLTVERGADPRDFALLAFGGAGPPHAAAIFRELGAERLVVPPNAAVFSAFGMLVTNLRHSYSRTHRAFLRQLDLSRANELMSEMKRRALVTLEEEGVPPERMRFEASMDLSYEGQIHNLNVPVSSAVITPRVLKEAEESLAKKYESLYGLHEELPVQVVTLRLNGVGEVHQPSLKRYPPGTSDASPALKGRRQAWFEEKRGFIDTPVYDSSLLKPGNQVEGPAIVESAATTLVLPPGLKAVWDEYLNAVIK